MVVHLKMLMLILKLECNMDPGLDKGNKFIHKNEKQGEAGQSGQRKLEGKIKRRANMKMMMITRLITEKMFKKEC